MYFQFLLFVCYSTKELKYKFFYIILIACKVKQTFIVTSASLLHNRVAIFNALYRPNDRLFI